MARRFGASWRRTRSGAKCTSWTRIIEAPKGGAGRGKAWLALYPRRARQSVDGARTKAESARRNVVRTWLRGTQQEAGIRACKLRKGTKSLARLPKLLSLSSIRFDIHARGESS